MDKSALEELEAGGGVREDIGLRSGLVHACIAQAVQLASCTLLLSRATQLLSFACLLYCAALFRAWASVLLRCFLFTCPVISTFDIADNG